MYAYREFRITYGEKKGPLRPVIEAVKEVPYTHASWGDGPIIKIKDDEIKPRHSTKVVRGDDKTEYDTELRQMRKGD